MVTGYAVAILGPSESPDARIGAHEIPVKFGGRQGSPQLIAHVQSVPPTSSVSVFQALWCWCSVCVLESGSEWCAGMITARVSRWGRRIVFTVTSDGGQFPGLAKGPARSARFWRSRGGPAGGPQRDLGVDVHDAAASPVLHPWQHPPPQHGSRRNASGSRAPRAGRADRSRVRCVSVAERKEAAGRAGTPRIVWAGPPASTGLRVPLRGTRLRRAVDPGDLCQPSGPDGESQARGQARSARGELKRVATDESMDYCADQLTSTMYLI